MTVTTYCLPLTDHPDSVKHSIGTDRLLLTATLSPQCRLNDAPKIRSTFACSDSFAMNSNQKKMTATWLREGRLSKGLTQKELAEKSNISIRSIQRIENGDLIPRSYTLKTLASILELSFEEFMANARQRHIVIGDTDVDVTRSKPQRIILSVGLTGIILLMGFAWLAQAPDFPETTFELLIFLAAVLGAITLALYFVWRNRR